MLAGHRKTVSWGLRVLTVVALAVGMLPLAAAGTGGDDPNDASYWCEHGIKYGNVDALTFTVPNPPEGWVWTRLILKAGSAGSSVKEENFQIANPVPGQAYSWQGEDMNGNPVEKEISHAILCKEPIQCETPTVELKLVKTWVGDDHGGATVEFYVDGQGPVAPDQVIDVTDLQGRTVTLEEVVTGLPDSTSYESDMPATLTIPEVDEDTLITLEVENRVTGEEGTTTTSTTTTVPEEPAPVETTTTSTVPTEVLPTVVTTSTVPTEVLPTVVTTTTDGNVGPVVAELPFTGSNTAGWIVVAVAATALGSILVVTSRGDET